MTEQTGRDLAASKPDAASNYKHILVVEDNADVLRMLCELLRILGHTFRGAQNSEEAMNFLAGTDAFDVLLTDITLPGMSGIELARIVASSHPAMTIIFTSGYSVEPRIALDFPFFVLPKPYTLPQLLELLGKSPMSAEIQKKEN